MTTQEALFPDYEADHQTGPDESLSADRRRTLRQRAQVERGIHPLTQQRARPDLGTCGDCRFRRVLEYRSRSHPKCTYDPGRMTHGAGTDVRAWWPACSQFDAADPWQPFVQLVKTVVAEEQP